ncbi:transcription initiation protein SPT3 homolog isoform X2 [Tachypleus tridentatus]|uniref:transcription initiation protein SPT3 homolog isoform X2 n=1 Tax=Tachypleus tridentatus TaxID=6853 RepID=UPI003FD1975A
MQWRCTCVRVYSVKNMVNEQTSSPRSVKQKPKPKKPVGSKSPRNISHLSDSKTSDSSQSTSVIPTGQKGMTTAWFTSEIQTMMHGFGDSRKPLLESAQLIEEIVRQQLNLLLFQSSENASFRGARFIGLEDVLFLLRKDKVKLSRVIKYLNLKDLKHSIIKGSGIEEEELVESAGGKEKEENKMAMAKMKRTKLCYDFLSSIDQTEELLSAFDEDIFDEVKLDRQTRADRQTRCMNQGQYLEFCESRRMSFSRNYRSTKFRDWLLRDGVTDMKLNALALEIFNYLAYETVAQIVDLALLVKKDAEGASGDPVDRLIPLTVNNPEYPSIQLGFHNSGMSLGTTSESPTQGCSPSPTSPASSSYGNQSPGSSGHGKPKPKKQKKMEEKTMLHIPTSNTILPDDIREVVQRYWSPSGSFVLFSKIHHPTIETRLLCC